jgi:uncharacterized protein (TIGR03437 family)
MLGLAVGAVAAWSAEISPAQPSGASDKITGSQVWKASAAPRLVHGVVTVAEGASLTIEAGANILFDGDLNAGIHVLGKLTVTGTAERPVTLRSAGSDSAARWRGVWTDAKTATVNISNAAISGAVTGVEDRGGSVRLSSVEISGSVRATLAGGKTASLSVENAKLTNNTFGIDAFDGASVSATGTRFTNNRTAVSLSRTGLYLASNEFANNQQGVVSEDAGLVKGSGNRVVSGGKTTEAEVAALVTRPSVPNVGGAINADATWTTSQSPVLVSSNIHVASGATLTIQPGVVVRFAPGGDSGITVDGSLVAVGTEEKPIYFTSSLDHGTKFNLAPGGFDTTTANAGDWDGIRLNGKTNTSHIEHATVRYSRNGILVQGSAPVVSASNSFRDDIAGLSVTASSASVTSSSDSFINNGAGVQLSAGNTAISSASFAYDSMAIFGAAGATASVAASTVTAGTVATTVAKQAGFELAMKGSNALAVVSPAVSSPPSIGTQSSAQNAAPAAVRIGTQGFGVTIMPSFTTVPGVLPGNGWAVPSGINPRVRSNTFAAVAGVAPHSNQLQIGIANAQAQPAGNDLGIYQGYQHAVAGTGAGDVLVADLFVPASWQSASTLPVATYLWAIGNGNVNGPDYAVIGFRNYSSGQGTFTIWNENTGSFSDLPNAAVNYNGWNNLSIYYAGLNNIIYFVNGVQVGTTVTLNSSSMFANVFMSSVNFDSPDYTPLGGTASFGPYTSTWSDTVTPPTILTTSIPSTFANQSYTASLSATEGAPRYTWALNGAVTPAGSGLSFLDANAGVLHTSGAAAGSYTIPVMVTDAEGATATGSVSWTVSSAPPPLSINPASPPAGVAGQTYAGFNFTASGGSGSPTWTLFSGTLPGGMSLSTSGALSGTPAAAGSYSFTVQATSGASSATASVTVTVYNALSITTSTLPGGVRSQPYGPTTVAASGGSGVYSWSGTGFPTGVGISPAGQVSGTPTVSGSFTPQVTVTDSNAGQTAQATFSITITVPPLLISAPAGLPSLVAVTNPVTGTFTASGGTSPYTFTASGLPGGVSLSSGGALSGGSTVPGVYGYTVTVTDSASTTASTNLSLGVLGFTTSSLPTGTAGTTYSASLSALGAANITFSGASVDGLTIASSGLISGTPTASGSFTVSVTATASGVSVAAGFGLTINAAPIPLSLTGGTLSPGQVNAAYSAAITANGGKAPYVYTVTGGVMPTGLQLAPATGLISGSPSLAGTSVFTVQVSDSSTPAATASGVFTLVIAPQTLTISNVSFPQGVVGVGYPNQVITGTGGVAPYKVAFTGTLPPGLTLDANGNITGTPTTAGTSGFILSITDSNTPTTSTVFASESITIVSNASATLVLSQTSLSFTLSSGATAATLPPANSVSVGSSVVLQLLSYTVSGGASWLTVTPAAGATVTTPGNPVGVALNANALTLAPGTFSSTIVVTCVAPSPCAGAAQNINVALTVNAPPASLATSTPVLSFSTTGTTTPPSQSIFIQNVGGGTINSFTVSQADNWYTVAAPPSSLPSGPAVPVSVSINPNNTLAAGYYTSTATINSSAGKVSIQITFRIAPNLLSLSQGGAQVTTTAGVTPAGTFSFAVGVLASASWSASVQGAPWLSLGTGSGTSTPGQPGTISYSFNSAAASLAAGIYAGIIQVSSDGAGNTPVNFVVALTVTAVAAPVVPFPSPGGLLFLTTVGNNPAPKTVTVRVNSANTVSFQASPNQPWLSVASTGTASTAAPGSSSVSVNVTGLVAGLYIGQVGYQTSSGSPRAVTVVLVVLPAGRTLGTSAAPVQVSGLGGGLHPSAFTPQATCTPTTLFVAQTGLVDNFQQPTALPTPLSVIVIDDCGSLVTNANVTVTFSNGDAPIPLSAAAQVAASGVYSGTWTPTNPGSQVSVKATAALTGLTSASAIVTGQVTSSGLPILTKNSTTNVYSAVLGAGIAPGTLVMMYGVNLAPAAAQATSIPLPTSLAGTSVTIGGIAAPLYYVGPTQINAEVPVELVPGNQYQVIVTSNGAVTVPDLIQVSAVSPGVASGLSGLAVAQHAANYATITEANPAKPGEYVTLYLSGLGATTVAVADGAASPSDPPGLAYASVQPTLTLNGTPVPISFAGLTPTLVGLFQINFQLPANTPNGDSQLVVTQSGVSNGAVILPVHN